MLWEMYQQGRINQASRSATRAESKAGQVKHEIHRLNERVEVLALACQSLWELLQDHTNLEANDLDRKMEEIDLRDGVQDGRMTSTTDVCSDCGRKTSRRRKRCIYCGQATNGGEAFGQR